MQLGFVTAIVPELSFEEVADFAADTGYSCIEVMCWPQGKAERRYAGVTHIDCAALTTSEAARLVSYAAAGVEPELMGYGPVPATQKALKKANLELSDIELIEVNEAFAAQYMACEKLLGLKRDIVNVNGSGIALGHPVGCTGTRIIISLLNEMKRRGNKLGLATLCVGGGMGMTSIWEMV